MASTINDIARMVGLSKSTVSRALTGSPRISAETREKVLEASKLLDYKPNAIARAMVTQKTGNIAFLLYKKDKPHTAHPFYGPVMDSIMDELLKNGYNMFVSAANDYRDTFNDNFVQRMIDGAILASHHGKTVVDTFRRYNIPIVLINSILIYDDLYCIVNNDYKGTYEAVEYLIRDKGHRRLAMLCGPLQHDSYGLRHKAFMDALLNYDIPVNYSHVRIADSNADGGIAAMNEVLSSSSLPTAVFAATDILAIGAMRAIKKAGLRIPEDIAVMGFDGIESGTLTEPALSTVWVDKDEMGRLAVQSLLSRINGEPVENRVQYASTKLIIREST